MYGIAFLHKFMVLAQLSRIAVLPVFYYIQTGEVLVLARRTQNKTSISFRRTFRPHPSSLHSSEVPSRRPWLRGQEGRLQEIDSLFCSADAKIFTTFYTSAKVDYLFSSSEPNIAL